MPEKYYLVITCEHAANHIPAVYASLFADSPQILISHRAYDPGALELARLLSGRFNAPCFEGTVSRLLVDCNRSQGNPRLFHPGLDSDSRADLLSRHYLQLRNAAQQAIRKAVDTGTTVLHLSIHTFTPVLDGIERQADVGLLYDPARSPEKNFCSRLLAALKKRAPTLRVRRNYPYRGIADGFTTFLRKNFQMEKYMGIEIEVNQNFVFSADNQWPDVMMSIAAGLTAVIREAPQTNRVQ